MKQLIISVVLLLGLGIGASVHAQDSSTYQPANINIDGRQITLDQPAVMVGDHVMVPLRGVFENLGASVDYHPDERSIVAHRNGTRVTLYLGSTTAMVNGQSETLDAPPLAVNSRILVPLRFVSEALGAEVHWMANTQTVNIESRTGGVDVPYAPYEANGYPPITHETGNLISSVSVNAHAVRVGDSVMVTIFGHRHGQATLRFGGQNIPMTEITPGEYQVSFNAPSSYSGMDLHLTVTLQTEDGRVQTIDRAKTVRILPY